MKSWHWIPLILLALSVVTFSYAQESSISQLRNKVVRTSGWRVLGLNEFVIVSGSKRINVDGVEVVAKTYGITGEHEPLIDFEGFIAQSDGSITINNDANQ